MTRSPETLGRGRIAWLLAPLVACAGAGAPGPTPPSSMTAAPGQVQPVQGIDEPPDPAGSGSATAPPSAAAPSPSAPQPPAASAAFAPLPPARPTTIALGDGELAAGDAAFERGDLAAAQKHYSAAPHGAPSSVGLARVRLAKVNAPFDYAAAKGNAEITAVASELARVVKTAPAFGPGFVELGRARLLLGDAPGCIDAMRRGTELLPDEPEAHSQLGVGLLATGHAPEAVKELASAVALDPGSAARHGNLGTALMMAGRTPEAIAEYETRVRIDASDARAHSDLGAALLGTQDLERALRELQQAVQLEPQRATFH